MELVDTIKEIFQNTVLFDSYRDSNSTEDRMFYKARLKLGNIFVYININDKDIFCPSRFAGFKNNNRQKHEAFAQKHGTHTTQKIDSIFGKHTLKKEIEAIHKKLCNDVGVTPPNKKREYWSMSISADLLQTVQELSQYHIYTEGTSKKITVNAYASSEEAKKKCIAHFGCKCAVCGFTFDKEYGEIGVGFIHVHHLKPQSLIKEEYQLDPIKDLRPVCPNCHAMLHKKDPPFSIDELKDMIKENQNPL